MKSMRWITYPVAVFVAAAVLSRPSSAQLLIGLDAPVFTVAPGGTVSITGSITNLGLLDEELYGISGWFYGPGLTYDDWAFFSTFPFSVGGGETVTGDFYWVSVDPSTIPNDYQGSFYVTGSSGDSNQVDVVIRVMGYPVPELGTMTSLASVLGLAGVSMLSRWRRRSSA